MSITDDLMGGEWEQHARSLYVETDGWIRGHYVPSAIHSVRVAATLADQLGTKGGLHQLHEKLSKLELEIERYAHRMLELKRSVADLHAIVLRARDEAPDVTPQSSEWSLIGHEDDEETWLNRNRNLYR